MVAIVLISLSHCYLLMLLGSGADPEMDILGGLNCLFHAKSFLTLLFAIRNIAVWGSLGPRPPGYALTGWCNWWKKYSPSNLPFSVPSQGFRRCAFGVDLCNCKPIFLKSYK